VNNVKIDLISHRYPLVENIDIFEGIRLVSLLDMGAMKFSAIYNSGKQLKNFVDMYFLLEKVSVNQFWMLARENIWT